MKTFEEHIREAGRKYLPLVIRQPLGTLAGRFQDKVLRPLQGLIFDFMGGKFRVDGCEIEIPKNLTSRAYRACFFTGEYEAEERALVCEFVRAEDAVLERHGRGQAGHLLQRAARAQARAAPGQPPDQPVDDEEALAAGRGVRPRQPEVRGMRVRHGRLATPPPRPRSP